MEKNISVIIPAFNEADVIGDTLKSLNSLQDIDEIIVVDDGSVDDTSKIAADNGARVIRLEVNMGKGSALNKAVNLVSGSIVVLLDADLGQSVKEVKKLLNKVKTNNADIAIAIFTATENKGGFGLVKKFASWIIKKYSGVILKEPLSGQRVFTKEAFNKVIPFSEGFGVEVTISIKALKKGMKIIEVPTEMRHRTTGKNIRGFMHRGRQLVDILRAVYLTRIEE